MIYSINNIEHITINNFTMYNNTANKSVYVPVLNNFKSHSYMYIYTLLFGTSIMYHVNYKMSNLKNIIAHRKEKMNPAFNIYNIYIKHNTFVARKMHDDFIKKNAQHIEQ